MISEQALAPLPKERTEKHHYQTLKNNPYNNIFHHTALCNPPVCGCKELFAIG